MNNHAQDTAVLWHGSGVDKLKLLSRGEVGLLIGPVGICKSQLTRHLALTAKKAMDEGTLAEAPLRSFGVVGSEPSAYGEARVAEALEVAFDGGGLVGGTRREEDDAVVKGFDPREGGRFSVPVVKQQVAA